MDRRPKPLDSKPIISIITKAGRATHALDRHTRPCNMAQGKSWASGLFVRAYTSIVDIATRREASLRAPAEQPSNKRTMLCKTSTSSMRDATPDRPSRIMSSTCLSTDGRWGDGDAGGERIQTC